MAWSAGGYRLAGALEVSDRVALHWDWICDVLDTRRLTALQRYTRTQLNLVNHALGRPAAAAALDPPRQVAI